jgi:hypothetical protein
MCGLRLPSTYVDINDQEMEYLDGGKWGWKEWNVAIGIGLCVGGIVCALVSAGAGTPATVAAFGIAADCFAGASLGWAIGDLL